MVGLKKESFSCLRCISCQKESRFQWLSGAVRSIAFVPSSASFDVCSVLKKLHDEEVTDDLALRLAAEADIPALERLIPLSVKSLQAEHYSLAQMEAALGPVFGVDRQLIRDGTYFVVENHREVVACGGWSRRRSVFGGDDGRLEEDVALDPATEPARIRAFFVHPHWARRGIGRFLLTACESAICEAGFQAAVLVATLTGEPLYASSGYSVTSRYEVALSNHLTLPVVGMFKNLGEAVFK